MCTRRHEQDAHCSRIHDIFKLAIVQVSINSRIESELWYIHKMEYYIVIKNYSYI